MSSDDDDFIDDNEDDIDDSDSDQNWGPVIVQPELANTPAYWQNYFRRIKVGSPLLSDGSLAEAMQAAFQCPLSERRPLLVYVHDEHAICTGMFCSKCLCHDRIIEYLMDNYVLWPWNNSSDESQAELRTLWQNTFGTEYFNGFTQQNYPMLIGIRRETPDASDWFAPLIYRFDQLAKADEITRTHQKISQPLLLQELNRFKSSFDAVEQASSYSFIEKSRLSWKVLIEISEYLTLHDAVKVFSPEIVLQLAARPNVPIHLTNRPAFVVAQAKKNLNVGRVTSFRIYSSELESTFDYAAFTAFYGVVSLHLYDFRYCFQIERCLEAFSFARRLSLWFSGELNFEQMLFPTLRLPDRITHLRLHAAGVACTHHEPGNEARVPILEPMPSVRYFLFDLDYYPIVSADQCKAHQSTCFLQQTRNFIYKMTNVELIRFRLSSFHVEKLFEFESWRTLLTICARLNKIFIHVLKESETEILIERAVAFEAELRTIRPRVIFRLVFE